MKSNRSRTPDLRALALALPLSCALFAGGLLLTPGVALAGGDWITYVDETSTRLVADPSVGVSDIREKDITSGDVDQDGDTDVIVVRKIPFTNGGGFRNVLFMNEGGVMTDRTATLAPDFLDTTDDRDVELADVDGDGWLDIITAGTFEEQPRILMNLGEDAGVWLGFEYQPSRLPNLVSPSGVGPYFCGLGVGDVTGDGSPDLYFSDYGGLLESEATDLDDRLLINDGTGFFTDETAARVGNLAESHFGTDADIADMNGDTFNDIVASNSTGFFGFAVEPEQTLGSTVPSPAVVILYNDGSGNFSTLDVVNGDAPYMVAPADFTQDGRLDLFVVDDLQDHYLVNTGNDVQGRAQFTTHSSSPSPNTTGFGGNVKFADLDNDGILDVLIADVDTDTPGCDRQLVLMQGQGTPPNVSYSDPLGGGSRDWTPEGTHDVEALHIDDDGVLDLFIGTCAGDLIFMGVDPDLVFEDGFESGDTTEWSAVQP